MENSLNVNVISKIRALCVVVSRNFYFNNVSFKIEFLKNLKNEIFKPISSFIKKIENHDVIFDISRVIAVTLTNDEKKLKFFSKLIYNFIVILQQKNKFVKFCCDEFVKTAQRKNNPFFKSMYFLNENEFLKYYDKIYVFDEIFVYTIFLKRYHDDKLTKHLKTNKTIKMFICQYY